MRSLLAIADQFATDVCFGLRSFRRTPALSLLALLSLVLGIGATTTIFSAVYSIVVDPFPYGDTQHLLSIQIQQPGASEDRLGFSAGQFLDLARDTTTFSELSASLWSLSALTGQGEPQLLDTVQSTPNLFRTLQVKPVAGRSFLDSDARPDSPAVVILSYKCWQRLFGGEASAIGKEVRINDEVRTVIGVMPERVYWLEADLYLPVEFTQGGELVRGAFLLVDGRLKDGVTKAAAEADLQNAFTDIARREPAQFPKQWKATLVPLPDAFPTKIRNELFMLLAAVGLLLTIACANVASLLVSKASARQKEMTIRASLGAGRGRIARQLLTESLLLALAGCLLGVLLAQVGLPLILSIVPPDTIPIEAKVALNMPVLLFSVACAFAVAVLTGLAPALHSSSGQLAQGLRENGRGSGGSRKQAGIREILVVAEVALSLVLLIAAGLTLRTLFALQNVPLGLASNNVLTMRIPLARTRFPSAQQRARVLGRYLAAIRSQPGVVAATLNMNLHPFDTLHSTVAINGRAGDDFNDVLIHQTDEQYLDVLRIPLIEGRTWTQAEVLDQRRLALVNQTFARRFLAGRSALGGSFRLPILESQVGKQPFEIAGVVADVLNQGLSKPSAPEVYLPYTITAASYRFAVRTAGDPSQAAKSIAAAIRAIDPQQPVTEAMSMDATLNRRLFSLSRFQLTLFGMFAAIGLALAVGGIYGVVSNAVERRTPELGIRMALGASSGQVVGLVLGSGMRLVLLGIALGLAGAFFVTRLMAGFLFGVVPTDPISYGSVALLLVTVSLAACLWPALRAARIDPVCSLRQE